MVNLLVAAALAAAISPAPVPQSNEPAMFVAADADTTIYLFGTFHALDGDQRWFGGGVRTAFEQSNELILETLIPEEPSSALKLGQPFRGPAMTPSGSFLATTRMAIDAGKSQGMQVTNGADMVLRHAAEAEGKRVEGLETLEAQLKMFTKMPAAPPPPPPAKRGGADSGEPIQGLSRSMADMQASWKRGDQKIFVQLLDQLHAAAPDTYRMMFTERNARWADWVAARLRTPGTVFVAVGAGHLAGRDSLLVRLGEKGIESRRVY